jgi:hypothetical protein
MRRGGKHHDQTGPTTGRRDAVRVLAEPDERKLSGTERLRITLGGGVVFSGLKRTTRINADLTQTQSTAGGSRVQSAGLHPPALAKPIEFRMISTEQQVNRICGLVSF